ncbi:N-acetylmuramoyl-L-alanine amidase [Chamaesiphon sp. VAR_48_metabat_135_sub]|uniref:N-acetylmuramoyl-L-alanine amidase n=1 Tax=Chamaesiphon sp. VAR_48_metabat_135_sub TaxID=2964699 RepID=UPI00286CB834|nr:N-acetylmuramoyl-L-alanine amidase [Chamaesiphon sp. VAR_48_metabat_135_sub]
MKFGIDCGHNCPPEDTGAIGIKREDPLTLDVGRKLMAKLASAGHSVVNCTPNSASTLGESLRKRVDKANSSAVDIFVSIHFNKFLDGTATTDSAIGCEIYALSNIAAAIARPVLGKIANLGFKNKGVKSANFFVLKNTSMPAILIEVCFLDSTADMNLFNSVGADRIAEAIKDGLIGDNEDEGNSRSGILKISAATILKPSTEQGSELPPASLVNIDPGNYPVLDFGFEERHWWVKWPDKSKANRDKHFIFEKFGRVEPN